MKRLIRFGGALAIATFCTVSVQAVSVTFDLIDTGATSEIESGSVTRGGVLATLTPIVDGSSGEFNQTGSGFGINATGSDDTDQVDGDGGAESVSISFDTDVRLVGLTISDFYSGAGDSASLQLAGFSPQTLVDTGRGTDVYAFASDNFVSSGENVVLKHVSGNGFSFDSFTVETVPSHWSAGCSLFFLTTLTGAFGWFRRRNPSNSCLLISES